MTLSYIALCFSCFALGFSLCNILHNYPKKYKIEEEDEEEDK
jgi:hypothetical protein